MLFWVMNDLLKYVLNKVLKNVLRSVLNYVLNDMLIRLNISDKELKISKKEYKSKIFYIFASPY